MKRVVCLYLHAFADMAREGSRDVNGFFEEMSAGFWNLLDLHHRCSSYKNFRRFAGAKADL